MNLSEAIDHCKEIIEENKECEGCINEHKQLLSWLEELREYRRKELKRGEKSVNEINRNIDEGFVRETYNKYNVLFDGIGMG